MRTLTAKVLDSRHLELSEPLPPTAGEWVEIVLAKTGEEHPERYRDSASDREIELASARDTGEDLLSAEELSYYLGLAEQ